MNSKRVRVLGIDFFQGSALEAVQIMQGGGLLVVPGAPALQGLSANPAYREALVHADLAITDSSYMILLWAALAFRWLSRLSGPQYLRCLLAQPEVQRAYNTLWVMATPASAERHLAWLARQGTEVPPEMVYMAPMYRDDFSDPALVTCIERWRPKHIILTIAGGKQEILGLHLKRTLDYLPAIHCIGAAMAMLSGDQVSMPNWVDRCYLGWLRRSISNPGTFLPRYWEARKLLGLMVRYRDRLPVREIPS